MQLGWIWERRTRRRHCGTGAPAVRQGEYAQYVLEKTRSANIYYDQESTFAWGVLWLPSGDQKVLRDFWLNGT